MPPSARRPVLRWISPTPSSSSTPPSPDLNSLSEALTESIPPPPPPARLPPPHFRPSNSISRPPPFFDNLTRSTLPTSSLSPPLPVSPLSSPNSIRSSLDVQRPPPIVLHQSSLTRSSLDSLRSVNTRTSTHSFSSGSSSASQTSILSLVSTANNAESSSTAAAWWWFQSDANTDALLAEEDRPADDKKEQIDQKYKATKNPVVFCHGLLGFDSVTIGPAIAPLEVTHWRGIKEVLEQNGNEVLITRVPATSSPIDRAKVLEEKISAVYPGRKVHLIGHSMGGLDCRYLTSHLTDRKFTVLSVTTIATPHRGSSFADHFLHSIGKHRLPQLISMLELLPNGGGDGKAFESLTLESMKQFNEETPDVPGVKYFSWGAVYEPGLIDTWKYPHSVILEKEGPNDGLVSIESAKWGTYLGTLHQVNHLDLVGWINTARYKWAEIMGKEIKFRPATFYLGIVDMLAREVEGQTDDDVQRTESPVKLAFGSADGEIREHDTSSVGTVTPIQASGEATPVAQGQMLESLDNANERVEGKHAQVVEPSRPDP
ncbi:hypothetical protein MD484_g1175, partial [Candolleomyces efflorescens]